MIKTFHSEMTRGELNNFSITFSNGFTVSISTGNPVVHCSLNPEPDNGYISAECAVMYGDKFYRLPDWDDDVKGWMAPNDILALMNRVAAL